MNKNIFHSAGSLLLSAALTAGLCLQTQIAAAGQSEWVRPGSDSKLTYKTLPAGDHFMDFSCAGYQGGGVKIPTVPVKATVSPSGGDDTKSIQDAINQVSQIELQSGFRGAVLLAPGVFNCGETLTIKADGVVLRGSGFGANGTTIKMTGVPHLCFSIGGGGETKAVGRPVAITDAYLPAGSDSFHVSSAENFKAGDTVLINRPATPAWVKFMGMDKLVRNGKEERWVSGEIRTERTIRNVSGNVLTLDVPLADSFDSKLLNPPGGSVVRSDASGRLTQIGVENLRIVSPPQAVTIDQPLYQAMKMDGVADAWVRDLTVENSVNSFYFGEHTRRLTIENVDVRHAAASLAPPSRRISGRAARRRSSTAAPPPATMFSIFRPARG